MPKVPLLYPPNQSQIQANLQNQPHNHYNWPNGVLRDPVIIKIRQDRPLKPQQLLMKEHKSVSSLPKMHCKEPLTHKEVPNKQMNKPRTVLITPKPHKIKQGIVQQLHKEPKLKQKLHQLVLIKPKRMLMLPHKELHKPRMMPKIMKQVHLKLQTKQELQLIMLPEFKSRLRSLLKLQELLKKLRKLLRRPQIKLQKKQMLQHLEHSMHKEEQSKVLEMQQLLNNKLKRHPNLPQQLKKLQDLQQKVLMSQQVKLRIFTTVLAELEAELLQPTVMVVQEASVHWLMESFPLDRLLQVINNSSLVLVLDQLYSDLHRTHVQKTHSTAPNAFSITSNVSCPYVSHNCRRSVVLNQKQEHLI